MSGIDYDDVPNWRGRDVIDRRGYAVGVLTDLYVDEATGQPEWGVIRTGLFSHRGSFVPLSQASAHGLRVQVAYDRQLIHDAPNVEPEGHLTADEEARLYQHYGLDYAPAGTSGADSEFISPTTDKVEEAAPRRLRRHAPAD